MKFEGTVKGPISEDSILRAMGGGRTGSPTTPPAELAPPPPNEPPPFAVRTREAPTNDVDDDNDNGIQNLGWMVAGFLVGLTLIIGTLVWLVTRVPDVPVDDEGRIPVVVVQKDDGGGNQPNLPTIVNEINVTINGDADDDTVKVSTPQTSRPRPRPQASPSGCVCPVDTLSGK